MRARAALGLQFLPVILTRFVGQENWIRPDYEVIAEVDFLETEVCRFRAQDFSSPDSSAGATSAGFLFRLSFRKRVMAS